MLNKISSDVNWVEVVDLFAHEYGWTIDYIKTLSLGKITLLIAQIKKRYDAQNQANKVPANDDTKVGSFVPTKESTIRGTCMSMGGKTRKKEDGTEEIVV